MGATVIAIYKAKEGCEAEMMDVIKEHLPILRKEGLATETPGILLEAPDGSILEIFDWVSQEAISSAHTNPQVLALWERFGKVSEYRTLGALSNAGDVFPGFKRLTLS